MNKHQGIALFVLLLAGFVTIFDLFVVNVAIVSIEKSLNASLTELTLIIVGYELAFGLLLITGGRLGDIFGKKTLYQAGMLFFILSSVLCALAPTAMLLVIARFIQGLSSAILFPQVYSSIRINFDQQQAKKAFGYLGMMLGLAAIAGQAFGGWLITLNLFGLSWRTIFLINIPIGTLAIALSHYLSEGDKIKVNLDWVGVILSSSGIGVTLLPFLMLPIWGWTLSSSSILIIGLLLIALFVYYEIKLEQKRKVPLLSIRILNNRPFVIGLFIVMCVYATSSAFPLLLSILLQNGLGLTPLQSGLMFVSASIGFVISSFITPSWVNRYGDKVLLCGAVLYGISYIILMMNINVTSSLIHFNELILILFFIGFTQGMIMTPMLNLVLSTVQVESAGMASGFTATLQQIGAAIGATAALVILQYKLQHTVSKMTFEQLSNAVSFILLFNVIMALCAAGLLWLLIRLK